MLKFSVLLFALAFLQSNVLAQSVTLSPLPGFHLGEVNSEIPKALKEAMEDFSLVQRGLKPKFAKFDGSAPLPADGGTTYYIGNNYKLTICKSLSSLGGVRGYIYGPVIKFTEEFAPGNMNTISVLQFYTADKLRTMLENANKSVYTENKKRFR